MVRDAGRMRQYGSLETIEVIFGRLLKLLVSGQNIMDLTRKEKISSTTDELTLNHQKNQETFLAAEYNIYKQKEPNEKEASQTGIQTVPRALKSQIGCF